ncbi:MAG: TIGR01459 family HAD-type hydrolase [Rhodobacteraceae bacterium]|nr:TIGR01459 family HAD-type hydrolase [Paracoccaceae bacterium]
MTEMIRALDDVAARYDVLFCDLWGCVHDGLQAYPAAVAALEGFRRSGGAVVLMTNAPRPAPAVQRGFDRLGIPASAWDIIVTSGDAAQAGMAQGAVGRRVWHLGPEKDARFFSDLPEDIAAAHAPVERVDFDVAEGIVCTGPFDEENDHPDDYRGRFLSAKARGLKLLCANPDIVVDYGDKRIWCAGALAALYTDMGGESLYFGKPHPPIYDLARRRLAERGLAPDPDRILAVGDGIDTDIRGGMGEGVDTLFLTGGLMAHEFGPDPARPDETALRAWLATRDTPPLMAMGRLR